MRKMTIGAGIAAAMIAVFAAEAIFAPALADRADQNRQTVQAAVSAKSLRQIDGLGYSPRRLELNQEEEYWRNVGSSFSKILR